MRTDDQSHSGGQSFNNRHGSPCQAFGFALHKFWSTVKFSLTESYIQKKLLGFWTGALGRGPVTQSGAKCWFI